MLPFLFLFDCQHPLPVKESAFECCLSFDISQLLLLASATSSDCAIRVSSQHLQASILDPCSCSLSSASLSRFAQALVYDPLALCYSSP